MNIENLNKMADFIETIPQNVFDMKNYRDFISDRRSPECQSVGCVIGHCTILDVKKLPRDSFGGILFTKWSEKFSDIPYFSNKWHWCFAPRWADTDNTPTGAAKRIKYLINHGLPSNWRAQMEGEAKLSYEGIYE